MLFFSLFFLDLRKTRGIRRERRWIICGEDVNQLKLNVNECDSVDILNLLEIKMCKNCYKISFNNFFKCVIPIFF